MIEHYFDNKHDIAIVSDGGFFCRACLVGKPTNKLSPDERYCTDCYDFLAKEAKLSTSRRSMDWKPVLSPQNGQGGGERVAKVSQTLAQEYVHFRG